MYDVRECCNLILFTCSCPVFPAPLIEETIFSPLYVLASFAIDEVTMVGRFIFELSILFYLYLYLSVYISICPLSIYIYLLYLYFYLSIYISVCLSIFLVLCQNHTVLIIVALWYSLKSGSLIPTAFFLKIALILQGFFMFQ